MTDDRKFVVAIFAARGDDTPRFVFADWLDEQAADRGEPTPTPFAAYLRRGWAWALEGEENCICDLVCMHYRVPPEEIKIVPALNIASEVSWYAMACECSYEPPSFTLMRAPELRVREPIFAVAYLTKERLRTTDGSEMFVWHGRCEKCRRIHVALTET
jgi:uncharacterized protein (TIGR02996 family)